MEKQRLILSFYLQEDVVSLAEFFLGKNLCTNTQGEYTSGMIVKTEPTNPLNITTPTPSETRGRPAPKRCFSEGALLTSISSMAHTNSSTSSPTKQVSPHVVLVRD